MNILPPLEWRRARLDDVPALTLIFNQSVKGGGHSPILNDLPERQIELWIRQAQRYGWPFYVLGRPASDGGEILGWTYLRSICWGGEATRTTGDLALYVAEAWQGSGAAMRMMRLMRPLGIVSGFETVTVWILASNRRSLSIARACRLQRWALLPGAVCYGSRRHDLEIWGTRLDDPSWRAHMHRIEHRYARLEARARSRLQTTDSAAASSPEPADASLPAATPLAV